MTNRLKDKNSIAVIGMNSQTTPTLKTLISLLKRKPNFSEERTVIVPLTTVKSVEVGFIVRPIALPLIQIAIRRILLFTSLLKAKRGCAMNGTDRSYTTG
jgi:hypothetical protein